MPNHPNRGLRPTVASTPKPSDVREFRDRYKLTPDQAGALVHVTGVAWERWESGERPMHPAFFELARIKMTRLEE